MRVLMLTSSYPKYAGETTAPFIEEIAAGLAARGHHIDLVAPWHANIRREPIERGVHLHFFRYAPHPALNIWGYAESLLADTRLKRQTLTVLPLALSGTMRALYQQLGGDTPMRNTNWWRALLGRSPHDFDLIHAHWAVPNGLPAAMVARHTGLPLVVSLHGSDIYLAERSGMVAMAAAFAMRSARIVTACSTNLGTRGVAVGARASDMVVIPYGVHPDEFRPDPGAAAQVHSELGLAPNTPLVMGLGRLVHKKGFDVLLQAWARVIAQVPQAHLVIIGYGDLRTPLEEQAQALGVTANVTFTGQIDRRRIPSYVAAADVFTLSIVRDAGVDGLPNVLLEAMSAGRPIVASRVAGVPDVITDNEHGLLVPDREPETLATAIVRLLRDRELATRLGNAARHRIERELTWEQTAARFERAYERALS